MFEDELLARGLSINVDGLVLDESGNEYRNIDGEIEYLEGLK